MAGAIKLLHYQILAYWRKVFSARGKYDKLSFFLGLIILLAGYRFVVLLNQTVKSLSEGKTGDLNLLLGIAFLVWILPVFESQKSTEKLANFVFLPLTQNQFSLIYLVNVFLVPTSIIAVITSSSLVYPLFFTQNFAVSLAAFFFYCLSAAFFLITFVRLQKFKIFRLLFFLTAIVLAIWGKNIVLDSQFFQSNLVVSNSPWLIVFSVISFLAAFLTIRLTITDPAKTARRISPHWLSKIRLPMRFGEMIKKDFLAFWKTFDSYISLLISTIYVIILLSADISFFSFSVAISTLIMMCGGLAFNLFGLENTASLQRLSLLPIKPKDLFIAKNKAFVLLIFSQTFFLFPLIFYKFGFVFSLAAILKTIAVTLFYLAWGNSLSIRFPFKMSFYEVSFGGSLQDMLSAVFLITLVFIVPDFLLIENSAFIILLANLGLVIISYSIYLFSLSRVSNQLSDEWENIAAKLS